MDTIYVVRHATTKKYIGGSIYYYGGTEFIIKTRHYTSLGPARGFVTRFIKRYPNEPEPEIVEVKLSIGNVVK